MSTIDPQLLADLADRSDVAILALTIWGEARGEGIEGQIAVGSVIRNRVIAFTQFRGRNYRDICLAPKQFSCWNPGDVNQILLRQTARTIPWNMSTRFAEVLWIAEGIDQGRVRDRVNGATHYLTRSLYDSAKCPSWAKGVAPLALVGAHVFLKVK